MKLSPSRARRVEQLDLLDGASIEPGVIVARRYCVIGPAEGTEAHLQVAVTDLQRTLGAAPHHRLTLYLFEVDAARREQLRRAFDVASAVQPEALSLLEGEAMLGVVTAPRARAGGSTPPPRHVALALAGLLADLHDCGVHGVHFHSMAIRVEQGAVRLADFAHLAAAEPRDAREDLVELVAWLRQIEDPALREVLDKLDKVPASAQQLRELLSQAIGSEKLPWSAVLPAEPPFVGRQHVLRAAAEALSNARIAQPSLISIEGAAGSGKSRLLRQAALELRRGNAALVLHAEFDAHAPPGRGALFESLDRLAQTSSSFDAHEQRALVQRLHRATDPLAGILRRVSPALAELLGEVADPPEIDLGKAFTRQVAVLADALGAVGTPKRPVVLLIDNIDQADRGSSAVLGKLLAAGRSHHSVVIATARGALPSEVREADQRFELAGLGERDLGELVSAALPGAVVDRDRVARELRARSDGLPLSAWPVLQQWIDDGQLGREEDGSWRLADESVSPASTRALYEQRLKGVDEEQIGVLLLAAVIGGPVTADELASIMSWSRDQIDAALAALWRQGLLVRDAYDRSRFFHGSIRDLVLERFADASPRAHARKLEHLRRGPSRAAVAQLAYHAELARTDHDLDQQLAIEHLDAGAEMLGIYDLVRARWHFERVQQRSDDRELLAQALEGAASVALLQDRVGDAALGYALAMDHHEQREQSVLLAAWAAHALMWRSALGSVRALIDEVLRRIGTPLPLTKLGRAAGFVADALRALLSVRAPRRLREMRESLCQLYPIVIAADLIDDPQRSMIAALRGVRLARGLRTPGAALSLSFWAAGFGCIGRFGPARRLFARADEHARDREDHWAIGVVAHMRAHTVDIPSGAYSEGLLRLDEAVASFRRTGDLSVAALSLLFKAAYGRDIEPCSTLERWLDESQQAVTRQGQHQPQAAIDALRLLIRARQGRVDSASAIALEGALREVRQALPDVSLATAYLIETYVEYGDIERARDLARYANRESRIGPVPAVFVELHVATMMAFEAADLTRGDRRISDRARRRVRRLARRFPMLAVTYNYLEARRYEARHDFRRAARRYRNVIELGTPQKMQYLTLEAHRALGRLLAAADVLAAAEHTRLAEESARHIGVANAGLLAPPTQTVSSVARPSATSATAIKGKRHAVLEHAAPSTRKQLALALGADVELDGWIGLIAKAEPSELKLLAVNLLLTARDAGVLDEAPVLRAERCDLDVSQTAELSLAEPGRYVCLSVTGDPMRARGGPVAGMRACRHLARQQGGFIHLESSDALWRLRAFVPEIEPSAEQTTEQTACEPALSVAVVAVEARVTETVLSALERFGLAGTRASAADLELLGRADIVFVDSDLVGSVSGRTDAVLVPIRRRVAGRRLGPLELGVPFTLDELETLLDEVTSGKASRPE
ncbi:MAG: AAA family ATPase [Myxococcales bacterium]|nr:AAA family ATPase [Myxococcales bacterium]